MKRLSAILLMIFFSHPGNAQESITDEFKYKISYNLTYQPDSTDAESKKKEKMFLYIGDKTSRFSSAGKAIGDSLQAAFRSSSFDPAAFLRMRRQIPETEFNYDIYKGVPTEKITYVRNLAMDKYRYSADKNLFNWTILPETDTIAGFRVQKAMTRFAGRDYTAWFTNEVAFPEGPYKFNGLPGLIIKIKDKKGHYVFELTQVQKLPKPVPFTFQEKESIETNQVKLSEMEQEYRKDPLAFTNCTTPGIKISFEPTTVEEKEIERERKEKIKKENNPLELD